MEFKEFERRNPLKIKPNDAHYFTAQILRPHFSDTKTTRVKIPGVKAIQAPVFKKGRQTLGVADPFELVTQEANRRGNVKEIKHKFNPMKQFLGQNKDLERIRGKYKQKNVDKRVRQAKRQPKMSFSQEPVKLVKPRYGKPLLNKLI
tara:strand:+ start:278 stop:718 length:441 start_codon:yes stop_codon:yes gene_type:complete